MTQSETRAAILQAIKLYHEEQGAAAKKLDERLQTPGTHHTPEPSASPDERLQTPGTHHMPEPSAPPAESMGSVPVAECVVCMEEKASIFCKGDNFVCKIYNAQFLLHKTVSCAQFFPFLVHPVSVGKGGRLALLGYPLLTAFPLHLSPTFPCGPGSAGPHTSLLSRTSSHLYSLGNCWFVVILNLVSVDIQHQVN